MGYGPAKRGLADDHIRPPATDTWLRAKEAAAHPPFRRAVVVSYPCTLRATRDYLAPIRGSDDRNLLRGLEKEKTGRADPVPALPVIGRRRLLPKVSGLH